MSEAPNVAFEQVEALTRINLEDFVTAVGWQNGSWPAAVARYLLRRPARRFARQMANFDAATSGHGLPAAARHTIRHYVRDVQVFGAEQIPDGPFLALSNHPGMMDTLALFAAIGRDDLKVLAAHRPFLLALPNVAAHLLYLDGASHSNISPLRRAIEHLREGHPLLTFPAGQIEPDPDVFGGAVESLARWSDSTTIFLRTVPDLIVLPVLVKGVVWRRAAHNFLASSRRDEEDRGRMAAAIQSLIQFSLGLRPVTVRVQIGRPISSRETDSGQASDPHEAVLAEMRRLISQSTRVGGRSAI